MPTPPTQERRLALIEDDDAARRGIARFFRLRGFAVEEAAGVAEGFRRIKESGPDLILADYDLPDGNALDLLSSVRNAGDDIPMVVLTGHGSIELAVKAIQEGAEQFLTKPLEMAALAVVVDRILDRRSMLHRQRAVEFQQRKEELDPFLGPSPAMRRLKQMAHRLVGAEVPILITGETGAGKGVLARWLSRQGPRRNESFLDLNCAGLTRELLESELYGHEKGAFTGAFAAKPGLFELAHRGTLFLDELGDMDPQIQAKLLKVLEEKQFRRLGGTRDRVVDFHLIAATHQDLEALVKAKRFREDLYYRIAGFPLHIPPLRERPEDLPVLVRDLAARIASVQGRGERHLEVSTLRRLQEYPWPGNIRELRNAIERAVLLGEHAELRAEDFRFLPAAAAGAPAQEDLAAAMRDAERAHIAGVVRAARNNMTEAARRLGISRSTLYEKLKRFDSARAEARSLSGRQDG